MSTELDLAALSKHIEPVLDQIMLYAEDHALPAPTMVAILAMACGSAVQTAVPADRRRETLAVLCTLMARGAHMGAAATAPEPPLQ